MAAGEEAETLAKFVDRLCAEFGYSVAADEAAPPNDDPRHNLFGISLTPEQERLVLLARQNLNRFASALGARHRKMVSQTTYDALLDGAETALRSELASGVPIIKVMPSLVFLVALPMVTDEEAFRLSQRSNALLKATESRGRETR